LPESAEIYKVEPYVAASDVYASEPHVGRGGWTWLSGSAAWMYRLIVESLLGLTLQQGKLGFAPCLPADWKEAEMLLRYGETLYRITMRRGGDEKGFVKLDGRIEPDSEISLADDREDHIIEVVLPTLF
jgi:cellobiose phosphorylase